jgi:hypothetical protein
MSILSKNLHSIIMNRTWIVTSLEGWSLPKGRSRCENTMLYSNFVFMYKMPHLADSLHKIIWQWQWPIGVNAVPAAVEQKFGVSYQNSLKTDQLTKCLMQITENTPF